METSSQMHLRPFTPSDSATILSWCKTRRAFRLWSADRYKDFPATPEDMANQYADGIVYPLVAVADNQIVGHLIIRYPSEDKTVVRFGFVIIDDTKRDKGYGKAMLTLAIDYAQKQLGAKKITLGVFTENPSAIACYKSVGFKITSERNHIIDGEEWQGVEMEREITL